RQAADAGAELRCVKELARDALILGNEAAGEVEGAAGDVGVDVDAARKHHHPGRVDGAHRGSIVSRGNPAIVTNPDVLDDTVDAVGRIVHASAGNLHHSVPLDTETAGLRAGAVSVAVSCGSRL